MPYGLFNGVEGKVIDILYLNSNSNTKSALPGVIMVEFPTYTVPPFSLIQKFCQYFLLKEELTALVSIVKKNYILSGLAGQLPFIAVKALLLCRVNLIITWS